eukprot:1148208-Pelagomonas_calceolata.AAC.1
MHLVAHQGSLRSKPDAAAAAAAVADTLVAPQSRCARAVMCRKGDAGVGSVWELQNTPSNGPAWSIFHRIAAWQIFHSIVDLQPWSENPRTSALGVKEWRLCIWPHAGSLPLVQREPTRWGCGRTHLMNVLDQSSIDGLACSRQQKEEQKKQGILHALQIGVQMCSGDAFSVRTLKETAPSPHLAIFLSKP